MTTHTPELVMALSCLAGLLALLAVALWQRWRASRNERTDRLMRRGMAEAYKRGLLARHSVMGEMWMEQRTNEPETK